MYLDTSAHVDTEAEKARLKSEIENKKEYIRIIDIKLTNKDFVKNAPEKIIRIEQDKKRQVEEQLEKLLEKYSKLAS
jgi:valyl-tRNA synthetase